MEITVPVTQIASGLGIDDKIVNVAVEVVRGGAKPNSRKQPRSFRNKWEKFSAFAAAVGLPQEDALRALEGKIDQTYISPHQVSSTRIEGLQAMNQKLRKELEKKEAYTTNIVEALITELGTLSPTPMRFPPTLKGGDTETAIALISDWQAGSFWTNEDTSGFGNMSTEIIKERVRLLTQKIVQLVNLQRMNCNINKLVLKVLGDIVEGDTIFDSQGVFIDQHALAQMSTCLCLFEEMIITLLEHFPEGVTLYAVAGNHGRVGKKGEHHPLNNWDHVLYLFIAERFRHEPRVNVFISTANRMAFNLPEAPNWNHLILHGDTIKSHYGIPWYGVDRDVSRVSEVYDKPFHYVDLGHFHSAAIIDKPYGQKIVNGCLTGVSPLASTLGVGGIPKQLMYGIHPEEGKTWLYDIRVGDKPIMEPDENGIMSSYIQGIPSVRDN